MPLLAQGETIAKSVCVRSSSGHGLRLYVAASDKSAVNVRLFLPSLQSAVGSHKLSAET